jgi:purine-binding chemotaxis protein CheW
MQASADNYTANSMLGDYRQYATFYVDGLFFAVDVLKVQEVLRGQEMTGIPLAPKEVRGLINLRGQIVTAIDMRCRLGLKPRTDGGNSMNIVVRFGDEAISLLVDEIGDVVEPDAAKLEVRPDNINPEIRDLIHGVYKLDRQLLLILDIGKTISSIGDGRETILGKKPKDS